MSITISEISVSPDLANARVYTMPLGGVNVDAILPALNKLAPLIQSLVAKKVQLRRTPRLRFYLDDSFENAARMSQLLRQYDKAHEPMARKRGQPIHGWINLDKPTGISSAKAVAIVRRVFNAAKAGHGGTLDPLASGVLPIALGEATKTVSFAMSQQKSYEFELAWGTETSTDDSEGVVTRQSDHRPDAVVR